MLNIFVVYLPDKFKNRKNLIVNRRHFPLRCLLCSLCAIFSDCNCDLFLIIMGYIGIGDVVAVA